MASQQHRADDEIDLIELWNSVYRGKWIILVCFLLAVLIATLYVASIPKEYEAKVYVTLPSEKDIVELNQISPQTELNTVNTQVSIDMVYKDFTDYLSSLTLKKKFFDAQRITDLYQSDAKDIDIFFKHFVDTVKLNGAKNKPKNTIAMSMQLPTSAENIAELANTYVKTALADVKKSQIDDVKSIIASKIKTIKKNIEGKIQSAETIKNDRIAVLTEALEVAKNLDIKTPADIGVMSLENTPLFYRGYLALEKELAIVKKRTDNQPFTNKLRELQETLEYYQSLRINENLIRVAKVDSWAYPPDRPVKPRRLRSLALAGIAGIMVGLVLVLVRGFLSSVKARRAG